MTERVPTCGMRVFSKSFPLSSSHFLAGMTALEVSGLELFGAVSSLRKMPMCGSSALLTSSVYGIVDGSERMSSAVGISCACVHFPS